MNWKDTLKKKMPAGSLEKIQRRKTMQALKKRSVTENERFAEHYAAHDCSTKGQIESVMIFYVHQIEKGFSFDVYQYGRGKTALHHISDLIGRLAQVDSDWRNNSIYEDAVLALGEYRRRHTSKGYDITFMTDLFGATVNEDIATAAQRPYPNIELTRESKQDNNQVSFSKLVERRHAIRSYADMPVSRQELEDAIAMSLRTPSVCNRQPTRVRIFTDRSIISKALKIQGGFGGYNMPPALMLVTADLQAFMGVSEHNEGYIDGGLFSMSLLYSLEACGLAACPLNTMFGDKADEETRKLLDVPDNEVFIMCIAVGHFRETSRICRSQRFELDRVLLN